MKNPVIAGLIALLLLANPVFAEGLLAQKQAEPVQAQVTVQTAPQVTEEQAPEMIKVETSELFLQSHIGRRYSAYKVSVLSKYPADLDVTSASIENGVPGTIAASSTATSYGNVLWGLPLWLLGMGVAAVIISGKNNKAETEAFQFTNQIPTNPLLKNKNLSFNALVPLGQTPQIRLSFKDPKAGLQFSKNNP